MRVDKRVSFTIALAFVDRHVAGVSAYRQQIADILAYLFQEIGPAA